MLQKALFKDPIRWARLAAGTPLRFAASCVISLSFASTSMGAAVFGTRLVQLQISLGVPLVSMEWGMFALLLASVLLGSVVYPLMYLIALRGILAAIDRQEAIEDEKR